MPRFISRRILLVVAVVILSPVVWAGTINVPQDQPTIQAGIMAAQDGDLVHVAPGIYIENIDFLGKAVAVQSTDGPDETIIDGSALTLGPFGSVVTFISGEGPDSHLEGFTIVNGSGGTPGDIPHGGGILCMFSAPTIRNNVITGNSAPGGGGGIYLIASEGAVIVNNIIAGNTAGLGGGIAVFDCTDTIITNNTLSGNEAFGTAGAIANYGSTGTAVTNTIAWENGAPEIEDTTGAIEVTFSVVQGGWPGTGNLDEDPRFVDSGSGNFHLASDSPGIDVGSNDAPELGATDFEGDVRILCEVVDIGADESTFCEFRRGDADSDGAFNGLVDAIFVLSYQFVPLSPPPPCLDAADADDSGTLNGLVDGVFILDFQFLPGSPRPPSPGPMTCGPDPTNDLINCESSPGCS